MATARPKISLKIRVLGDEKTAGDWGSGSGHGPQETKGSV